MSAVELDQPTFLDRGERPASVPPHMEAHLRPPFVSPPAAAPRPSTSFVVPAAAYRESMDAAGVRPLLVRLYEQALDAVGDEAALVAACGRAQAVVRAAGPSASVVRQVRLMYPGLGIEGVGGAQVTVHPLAAPDGDHPVVRGARAVLARLVEVWAGLFRPEAVTARAVRGDRREPAVDVVVQAVPLSS